MVPPGVGGGRGGRLAGGAGAYQRLATPISDAVKGSSARGRARRVDPSPRTPRARVDCAPFASELARRVDRECRRIPHTRVRSS